MVAARTDAVKPAARLSPAREGVLVLAIGSGPR